MEYSRKKLKSYKFDSCLVHYFWSTIYILDHIAPEIKTEICIVDLMQPVSL